MTSSTQSDQTSFGRTVSSRAVSRRTVVRGAAVGTVGVAAAVTLSACNSEKAPDPIELPAADVPVGSGIIKNSWAVAQPTKGDFKAYSAVCPHQGCLVTTITNEQITCPCHNSVFSVADGSHEAGPATKGLTPAKIEKSGTTLKISAE